MDLAGGGVIFLLSHMGPEHASREKKFTMVNFLTSEGLKYPQEAQVQHETCSTKCGTPVQAILDQEKLTGLAGGVKKGQNMAQNGPRFYIFLASEPSRSP